MRKLPALLLALSLCAGALAACGNPPAGETSAAQAPAESIAALSLRGDPNYAELPAMGLNLLLPAAVRDPSRAKGALRLSGGGEIERGCGVYELDFDYYAMPPAELAALEETIDAGEDGRLRVEESRRVVLRVFAVDGGRDFEAVRAYLNEATGESPDPAGATVLKRVGEVTFYRYEDPAAEPLGADYAGEYERIRGDLLHGLKTAEYYAPLAACRVRVTDEAGNPLAGARVQLCTDTECLIETTDADGLAAFEAAEGSVHILKSPLGYAPDDNEYRMPDASGELTIVLEKE